MRPRCWASTSASRPARDAGRAGPGTMTGVDPAVVALGEEQAALGRHLDGLDDAGWAAPSRCEGWTVADVVLHLAQTNEMAIASLDGTMDEFLGHLVDAGLPATADVDE